MIRPANENDIPAIAGLIKESFGTVAGQTGCRVMNIGIVEENTVLRAWYEKNGAVHTGTKKYDFFPFTCGFMKIGF